MGICKDLFSKQVGMMAVSLALVVSLSACSGGGLNFGEKVATVDGTVITKAEYDKVSAQLLKMFNMGADSEAQKNPMVQEMVNRMTLERLIVGTLLKLDAKKAGITVSQDDIKKFLDEKVKEIGGEEQLKTFLKESNLTMADLNEKIEEDILRTRFFEKRMEKNAKVSEKDAQAFYKQHEKEFDLPEMIDSSHILVKVIPSEIAENLKKTNPKVTEAEVKAEVTKSQAKAKAKAQGLYDQVVKAPDTFAEVAKTNSEDPGSAKMGGALGPMKELQLVPQFWQALKKTKPGTIHPGLVETPYGYHIIRVKDHVSAHKQTFNEAKGQIMAFLTQEEMKKDIQIWFQTRKAQAEIKIEPKYDKKQQPEQAGMPQPGSMPMPAQQQAAGETPQTQAAH
jgi:parvulin-like peptidyl-prolyl isomerase